MKVYLIRILCRLEKKKKQEEEMRLLLLSIPLITSVVSVSCGRQHKRLVLHGEDDIPGAIASMQAEIQSLQTRLDEKDRETLELRQLLKTPAGKPQCWF